MMDMRYIREDFLAGSKNLARDKQINLLDEWFAPPFPDDTIVTNWKSENLKKVMRIQEDDYGDDGIFQFNGFVAKSGLDYEYDDLCVIAVASNEKAHDIFDLYQLWFVENVSPKEMAGILESYFGLMRVLWNVDFTGLVVETQFIEPYCEKHDKSGNYKLNSHNAIF